jgi:hypothetical protein
LVSKLRQPSVTVGSTLFKETWKEKVTPAGRRYLEHTASVPRTSGNDCGSWPTPIQNDHCSTHSYGKNRAIILKLPGVAKLASWPTARSTDGEKNVRTLEGSLEGSLREIERKGGPQGLNQAACLASWVTPRVSDGKDGNLCREGRAKGVSMPEQAQLASWVTPSTRDWKDTPGMAVEARDGRVRLDQLPRQASLSTPARLTASGEMLTGSSAGTVSGGPLCPAHSRWLLGLPPEWDDCVPMATRSSRR